MHADELSNWYFLGFSIPAARLNTCDYFKSNFLFISFFLVYFLPVRSECLVIN